MADIAKCSDTECPSRSHCYRFRAKPNEYRQVYAAFKHEGEKCEAYSSTEGWDEWALVPMVILHVMAPTERKDGE